jgi:hypothetical protein
MAEGLVYGPMMALTIVGAAMTDRPHGTNDRHAVYKGQRSVLTRTEPHTRRDGTTTTLMVWRSHCPTCGEPFERAHPHESALTAGKDDEHSPASIIVCDPLLFCRRVGFVGDHLWATEASVPAFLSEPATG